MLSRASPYFSEPDKTYYYFQETSEISSQNVDLKVKSNLTKRRAVDRLKIGDLAGGIFNGGLVIRKQYGGLV